MTDVFADAARALFDGALGCDLTVRRGEDDPVPLRGVLEPDVATIGDYGRVIGRADRISFIKSDWDPARGDVVSIDGAARPVEAVESDDGCVVTAVLHG